MPHIILEEAIANMKGDTLTENDREVLHERIYYAIHWLKAYAPERYVFTLQTTVPSDIKEQLSAVQKQALSQLLLFFEKDSPQTGEEVHALLHAIKESLGIEPKLFFTAIYKVFLGRESGPQAGWFLASLPRELVLTLLKEATT
jgi:lysyl-tRNA synthetase class 1